MEELIIILQLVGVSFLLTDYLKAFLTNAWIFNIKYVKELMGVMLIIFNVKPFSCPTCMSIWLTIVYCLTFDYEFILYLGWAPIITEGVARHLKSFNFDE